MTWAELESLSLSFLLSPELIAIYNVLLFSRILTLLVLALETGKEYGLSLVGAPELDGGVAHLVVTALGALPLDDGAVRLLVLLDLLLLSCVLLAVEVDDVPHYLLVEQRTRNNVLTDNAGHVSLGRQS